MKEHVTFRLENELINKVQSEADKNRISISEQYRNIIKVYFDNWYKKIFK
jgi:hypothetical protein